MILRLSLPLLLCALAAGPAAAAPQTSVVVAAGIEPNAEVLRIAADRDHVPTGTADLEFRLAPLPADAELASCALRLVLARGVPRGDDSGVLLQLLDAAAPAERSRPIAAIRVPAGTPKDTAVVLRSRDLCAALRAPLKREVAGDRKDLARLHLRTTIRDASLSLFGATPDRPSQVPRLLLGYEPKALPRDADWAQIRSDAGHSGRSPWRLYDPDGSFTPTGAAAVPIPIANVRTDLRQSPLLYRGQILTVVDLGSGQYRLAAIDRSGTILGQAERGELPRFLAAGGPNRLAYVTENQILLYDPRSLATDPVAVPIPGTETMREAPTIGRDGALYTVTQQYVRAFSAGLLEAWQFQTSTDDIGAVALSRDEGTAYVVLGGASPRLIALDARTGDCRWEQPLPKILHGQNEPMPVAVVAGASVLVTQAYPTGAQLYAVHDTLPPPAGDRGELIPPAPQNCRSAAAPRGMTIVGAEDDHIPAPMAGTGDDAYYLRQGELCRARDRGEEGTGSWDVRCRALDGCDANDTRRITLLIGDSSGGASTGHLYGLAAATKQLFFISANLRPDGSLAPTCGMQAFTDLGPNLVLAADGTLVNASERRTLQAIVPNGFAASAADISLSPELIRMHDGSAFRTPGAITTAPDLDLAAGTDIILVAGSKIVFSPGLRIAAGARLRARVGF